MSNPMTCSNGHFYPATMKKCPFCEREGANQSSAHTAAMVNPANSDDDKTRPVRTPNTPTTPVNTPTESGDSTRRVTTPRTITGGDSDDERTQIHRPSSAGGPQPATNRRKLEGWLVSFTMDPAGVDFRLYEGRNVVGRKSTCDIKLINDPKVSGEHGLIVFRGSESVFADDYYSSNPSFINGEPVALGGRVPLHDGARIKMGDHEFIFRKVNP